MQLDQRIRFCAKLRAEALRAMQYPDTTRTKELNAERERLAQEEVKDKKNEIKKR